MTTNFEISDKGQDGTDGSILCYVSNAELARLASLNRGAMGVGTGEIREIIVYDSFEELPEKIQNYITKAKTDLDIKKNLEIEEFLNSLSADERQSAFDYLRAKI